MTLSIAVALETLAAEAELSSYAEDFGKKNDIPLSVVRNITPFMLQIEFLFKLKKKKGKRKIYVNMK